jgi:hypothetical protein
MCGDSLKIGSMQSPSPLDSLGQFFGRPTNEKPFLVLPVGFPTDDDEVSDNKKKMHQPTSHFFRMKSVHEVWKLLLCVRIYSGFRCKMFCAN